MNARKFRLAMAVLVAIFVQGLAHADIKVGSYSWAQKFSPGAVPGVPAANQYGAGYCHLDISWTWTLEQGYGMANGDWTSAVSCLEDDPTAYAGHLSAASANYYIKGNYPATWTRMKTQSDAGRYDPGAMDWSEGYWSFGSDEYYLRNYYISTRFCKDNFGYTPVLSACYDLDAPSWSQPKMQSYIVGRSAENPQGLSFYNHRTGAGGVWDPNCCGATMWNSYKWTSDDGSTVIVGNGGNWGGDAGGCETCVKSAGTTRTFAGKVFQENVWPNITNVWSDNLVMGGSGFSLFWWGARMVENRLLEAEKFGSFARPFGYTYPFHGDSYLYGTWGNLLQFNQHDVADAQGTPWQSVVSNTTNMNIQDATVKALKLADTSLTKALSAISVNVNTSGTGVSVIVYNAMSWARTSYAMTTMSDLGLTGAVSVKGPDGGEVPSQVMSDRGVSKLVFVAEAVPSLGFKEYKVTATTSTATTGVTASSGTVITLDNSLTTVKINKTSGVVTSIYDKVNAKELLSGAGNQIASTTASPNWWDDCCQFYSHVPNGMPPSLTYKTPTSVTLVDSGPAIARVKILYAENGVNWEHNIMLFNKDPIVHNRMSTANLTNDNELALNLSLNTAVSNAAPEWNVGTAYGHQKYVPMAPANYKQEKWTYGHRWANVANDAKNYSVTLLENNCSPWSFYGIGGAHDLRTVLIAEKTSRWSGHWSKTDWEMSWGIWGHTGDWTDGAAQKGYEFNSPLIARVEKSSHTGTLPKEYSFLTVEPENIIVTAVKKWEDELPTRSDSLTMQVRFYEIDGKNTDAVLKFPSSRPISAWESMGNEYGVYGNKLSVTTEGGMQKVTFATGHNQIRSLKVQVPYGASSANWGAQSSSPTAGASVIERARICNARGQTIWHGSATQLSSETHRLQSANGVYLVQLLTKDDRLVYARRLCRSEQFIR